MTGTPKCRLCGLHRNLCDSHVIPEFAFKPVYDEKHRVREMTDLQKGMRTMQKGLREPLLCEECEQHINTWERYFKGVWYDRQLGPVQAPDELMVVEGLDYSSFKLFHLSVLWRAGVASGREFAQVVLGPHEARLRAMLLKSDPGPEELYPFFAYLLVFRKDNSVCHRMVGIPMRVKSGEHWGYEFVFGGAAWHYVVSGHDAPEHATYRFDVTGRLKMLRLPVTDYRPIHGLMRTRRERGWTRKNADKPCGYSWPENRAAL